MICEAYLDWKFYLENIIKWFTTKSKLNIHKLIEFIFYIEFKILKITLNKKWIKIYIHTIMIILINQKLHGRYIQVFERILKKIEVLIHLKNVTITIEECKAIQQCWLDF